LLLGDDFGAVTVQDAGIKVELNSDDAAVVVYTNGDVEVRPAANDDGLKTESRAGHIENIKQGLDDLAKGRRFTGDGMKQHIEGAPEIGPQVGDEMQDGTILAGYSEGKPLYTTPADAVARRWFRGPRLTHTFNQARKYAENLDAHGHDDWRVPTKGELNVLWENRNKGRLKGTFNETGSSPAWWYRSSTPGYGNGAGEQRFSDGYQNDDNRGYDSSLRCVRWGGTGRLRRTTTTRCGRSASATGISSSTSPTSARPCSVCGKDQEHRNINTHKRRKRR